MFPWLKSTSIPQKWRFKAGRTCLTLRLHVLHSVFSMSPSLRPSRPAKTVAKWANLPRRKCDNCGKSYKPTRPLRSIDKYGFCARECKTNFHTHGGAYRKLKGAMEKMVFRRFQEIEEQLRIETAGFDLRLRALESVAQSAKGKRHAVHSANG